MTENEDMGEMKLLEGKVQTIMPFGAFVTLQDGSVGLVHISEISDDYVKDVNDFLRVGQSVKVVELPSESKGSKKRLSIKKTGVSLKQMSDEEIRNISEEKEKIAKERKENRKKERIQTKTDFSVQPPMFDENKKEESSDFSDKLAKFMKQSEERLVDIKHQTDNKRGGGYIRRG